MLDASRCISYTTIELRNPIPHSLRRRTGDWLFGCDVCQDVCPWNHKATKIATAAGVRPPTSSSPDSQPQALHHEDLHALFQLSEASFRERFRGTALWRSRRRGLLRNAAIVLGNQASPSSQDTLAGALQDAESLVRGAAAWALGQLGTPRATRTLRERLAVEQDPYVRDEIQRAMA